MPPKKSLKLSLRPLLIDDTFPLTQDTFLDLTQDDSQDTEPLPEDFGDDSPSKEEQQEETPVFEFQWPREEEEKKSPPPSSSTAPPPMVGQKRKHQKEKSSKKQKEEFARKRLADYNRIIHLAHQWKFQNETHPDILQFIKENF